MEERVGGRSCIEVCHVLADRDARTEKLGVGRSRQIVHIIYVERINADKPCAFSDQDFAGLPGQEWVRFEIRGGTPETRPSGTDENGAIAERQTPLHEFTCLRRSWFKQLPRSPDLSEGSVCRSWRADEARRRAERVPASGSPAGFIIVGEAHRQHDSAHGESILDLVVHRRRF